MYMCPMGIPFATKPVNSSSRSNAVECSGNGLCDRIIGVCACHEGFGGLNCERVLCPSSCNNRGRCLSMARASYEFGAAASYTNWESGHHFMCVCDGGFSGPDCKLRVCPRGDDPITNTTHYRTRTIRVAVASPPGTTTEISGSVSLWFQNEKATLVVGAAASNTLCTAAVDRNKFVSLSNCTVTTTDATSKATSFDIGFVQWGPNTRTENNGTKTSDGVPE